MEKSQLFKKMILTQYGEPSLLIVSEKISDMSNTSIQNIPDDKFLKIVEPILKKQFNRSFDEMFEDFLRSQNLNPSAKNDITLYEQKREFHCILDVIGDPICLSILNVLKEEMTMHDIISKTCLSDSTIYKKIEKLYELGIILKVIEPLSSSSLSSDPKRSVKYSKTIKSINLKICNNDKNQIIVIPKKEPKCKKRVHVLLN